MASLVDFSQVMGQQAAETTRGLAGLAEQRRLMDYQAQQMSLQRVEQQNLAEYRKAQLQHSAADLMAKLQQQDFEIKKGKVDAYGKLYDANPSKDTYNDFMSATSALNPNIVHHELDDAGWNAISKDPEWKDAQGEFSKALSAASRFPRGSLEAQAAMNNATKAIERLSFITSNSLPALMKRREKTVETLKGVLGEAYTYQKPTGLGSLVATGEAGKVAQQIGEGKLDPRSVAKPLYPYVANAFNEMYPGQDIGQWEAHWALQKNPQQQARIKRMDAITLENGPLDRLEAAIKRVDPSGTQTVNKIWGAVKKEFGEENVARLRADQDLVGEEIGQVFGSTQGSVAATNLGLALTGGNLSTKAALATIDEIRQGLTSRKEALTRKPYNVGASEKGKPAESKTAAPASKSTQPVEGATGMYEGKPVIFRGGKWVLK